MKVTVSEKTKLGCLLMLAPFGVVVYAYLLYSFGEMLAPGFGVGAVAIFGLAVFIALLGIVPDILSDYL